MNPGMPAKDFIKELFNVDLPIAGGYGENMQNAVKMLYEVPNDFILTPSQKTGPKVSLVW